MFGQAILPLAPSKLGASARSDFFARQRRMNLNALAIGINLFLSGPRTRNALRCFALRPWCCFCMVCCILSFYWHYQAPMLVRASLRLIESVPKVWTSVLFSLAIAALAAKLVGPFFLSFEDFQAVRADEPATRLQSKCEALRSDPKWRPGRQTHSSSISLLMT